MTKKIHHPKDMPKQYTLWVLKKHQDLLSSIVKIEYVGFQQNVKAHFGQLPPRAVYFSWYDPNTGSWYSATDKIKYCLYDLWYTTFRTISDEEKAMLLLHSQLGNSKHKRGVFDVINKAETS